MYGFPANVISVEGEPPGNIKDLNRVNHVFLRGEQI